jgi:von Willebrand factor type A domain/FHA domain
MERVMHRDRIAVPGDSIATYALLKLASGGGPAIRSPLQIALAIDVSGSMAGDDGTGRSRLDRVREGVLAALPRLQGADRISIVAFANTARLVLPATPAAEKEQIATALGQLDDLAIDGSGTAIHEGIRIACEALVKDATEERFSNLILLTDGDTDGGDECRELAREAASARVRFTLIGLGTEWNSALLKELTSLTDGRWYFVDAADPQATRPTFETEFARLTGVVFPRADLHVRPMKNVQVKRIRRVAPDIRDIALHTPNERLAVAPLGAIEAQRRAEYLLELALPKRPDAKYVVAQVEVRYSAGAGREETTGLLPLEVTYSASADGHVDPLVAQHLDEVQIGELNTELQRALDADDRAAARRLAEQIARKGDGLGARAAGKVRLAKLVIAELESRGRVRRETRLGLEDLTRATQDGPAPPAPSLRPSRPVENQRLVKCPTCGWQNENGALCCAKCNGALHSPARAASEGGTVEMARGGDTAFGLTEEEARRVREAPLGAPAASGVSAAKAQRRGDDVDPSLVVDSLTPAAANDAHVRTSAPPPRQPSPPPAPDAPTPEATPQDPRPRLLVLRGEKINMHYPLYPGKNFVGRTDEKPVDVDLECQEPPDRIWSSRQHAVITYEGGVLTIEDLNSLNGTFVNRTRIHPGQVRILRMGDVVQIGTVQMKVVPG